MQQSRGTKLEIRLLLLVLLVLPCPTTVSLKASPLRRQRRSGRSPCDGVKIPESVAKKAYPLENISTTAALESNCGGESAPSGGAQSPFLAADGHRPDLEAISSVGGSFSSVDLLPNEQSTEALSSSSYAKTSSTSLRRRRRRRSVGDKTDAASPNESFEKRRSALSSFRSDLGKREESDMMSEKDEGIDEEDKMLIGVERDAPEKFNTQESERAGGDKFNPKVTNRGSAGFRGDLGKRPSGRGGSAGFRGDLGKRPSNRVSNGFRGDLGKRLSSGFRGDLGKRMSSGFRGDLGKRQYSGFRGDLGKRLSSGFRGDLGKRRRGLAGFRGDLGKRAMAGGESQESVDAVELASRRKHASSSFRGDLGKREFAAGYDEDEGVLSDTNPLEEQTGYDIPGNEQLTV